MKNAEILATQEAEKRRIKRSVAVLLTCLRNVTLPSFLFEENAENCTSTGTYGTFCPELIRSIKKYFFF